MTHNVHVKLAISCTYAEYTFKNMLRMLFRLMCQHPVAGISQIRMIKDTVIQFVLFIIWAGIKRRSDELSLL